MSSNGDAAAAGAGVGRGMVGGLEAALSPALGGAGPNGTRGLGPAFEIKFLLTAEQAREVEERLLAPRGQLLPDPHCDPALGGVEGMYAITSLNCDAPDFGVFFRDQRMKNRKYRLRRYGNGAAAASGAVALPHAAATLVYLERKRSRQGRVRKRRVAASAAILGAVAQGRADDVSHSWFVRELRALDLAPVCRIRYMRRALFRPVPEGWAGMHGAEGPIRVTFDHCIRGALAPLDEPDVARARSNGSAGTLRARGRWSIDFDAQERPLVEEGWVVCEFKFRRSMPAALKAIVADMKLQATGFSKYRTCVRAFASELGLNQGQMANSE